MKDSAVGVGGTPQREGAAPQAEIVRETIMKIAKIRYMPVKLYLHKLRADELTRDEIEVVGAVPCFNGLRTA